MGEVVISGRVGLGKGVEMNYPGVMRVNIGFGEG